MSSAKRISGCIPFTFILLGLLTGCAVGPAFKRPATPDTPTYTATPLPAQTSPVPTPLGEAQHFVAGGWVNPQWWQELGSAKLNALIDEALQASPTLAKSQAVLRQAQELYAAQAGSTLYPQVDATLGAQRQRTTPSSLGQVGDPREFSLYNAGVGARYTLDLAGATRRSLEALAANIDYQRYQLEGARLTLTGNIATATVTQARLAGQIQATEAILHSQEEQLGLTRERVRLGHAAPDDVLALQTLVEQTRAGIPLLRNQLQQNDHLLAVLAGREPGAGGLPCFSLQEFTLPADLPLTVPSELVRNRPDIQAAEALLHSANAEYGVAIAKLYPQLNLSATLGSQALTAGALFGSGSAVWSLVAQLTQPLFNPGLPAEKRAALAAFDAAAANYRNVVLEALRNVADVLRALDNDAQRLAALAAADAAAQESLASMQRQYSLGAAGYIQLLTAQQQAQQTRISLIEAQARRLADSVALYQAMGGGRTNDGEELVRK
ncbi:MAG: efflux transporter outer membrane subunit [Deltaproteobacteria bacterium]|uniref:efflux transporter outer membrane subunit n=1 Tax=Hydrosulfovibrio ferrireducens TaxID=2934181 RepID=UPI0011F72B35|nr:MAG: efflux transporter outer membrane subunit [Deltaproteobacteria bacterium]